jgi:hypothetical protein
MGTWRVQFTKSPGEEELILSTEATGRLVLEKVAEKAAVAVSSKKSRHRRGRRDELDEVSTPLYGVRTRTPIVKETADKITLKVLLLISSFHAD